MLRVSSPAAISSIGKFLRDSGYDVTHLSRDLDLADGLFATEENLQPLLAKTEGSTTISVLARLFFVCWPVEESLCRTALPETFLAAAFACGLLTHTEGTIVTSACLIPSRSLILACDSARTRATLVDMVTGPSASTHFTARLAIGGSDEKTLDLGTGTGVLALEAAAYSRAVIGTDINPRTLQFAAFNAALNDIKNVEWRLGNAFEPVQEQRFSRIVANPPFFLSPANVFTYCDSPLDLDGFTAHLAKEAPAYLEEGGFYQMLCEWVEIEGVPWEERLRRWTSDSHCDVLVLLAPRLTPLSYAEKRTKEAHLMQSGPREHSFTDRLRYLTDRHVRHILAGVITMRKRTAASNWFSIVSTEPVGSDVGVDIRARFDALTCLATTSEQQLLAAKLQLAGDITLETRAVAIGDSWQTKAIDLVKQEGLVDRLRLDETVSAFLPLFNGKNSLAEIIACVSERLRISSADSTQRCLQLARRLLQSNFVKPAV